MRMQGHKAWLRERNEKAAEIFATQYLEHRREPGLSEFLAKLVVVLQERYNLTKFKIVSQDDFNPYSK